MKKTIVLLVVLMIGVYCWYAYTNGLFDHKKEVELTDRKEIPHFSNGKKVKQLDLQQEKMIAGIPESQNTGKFAAVRPDDLDPFSRWMPPAVREAWLEKSLLVISEKIPEGASYETRNVYFHLGFKDKPATCGEFRFVYLNPEENGEFQRFIYSGRSILLTEEILINAFDSVWQQMCVDKLYE